MYRGKMTKELEQLYSEYEKVWGCTPDFYENAEYGKNECEEYTADIRKSLEMGVELPEIYPPVDDEF